MHKQIGTTLTLNLNERQSDTVLDVSMEIRGVAAEYFRL